MAREYMITRTEQLAFDFMPRAVEAIRYIHEASPRRYACICGTPFGNGRYLHLANCRRCAKWINEWAQRMLARQ